MVEMSQQDVEALQEKMKNMSPEELRKLQKQQCVFCHIISGKVASKKVYDDEQCIAILDINPANPGHVLVLPKEHYPIMPLIPEEIIKHLAMVSKAISHSLLKALKAQGINIFVANGTSAGQKAQHFMVHVIPRKEGDNIGLDIPESKTAKSSLDEMQKKIKSKVNEMFGITEEKIERKKEIKEQKKEEAEEEKEEAEEEKTEKKKPEKKEPKKKTAKKKKEEEETEVGLDDIASLFGM